uniref:Uncharacterized protein n=1 Tax=Steinernema glaseri TaxID=37863 RepID=A0A1I7Z5U9_9BILA
MPYALLILEDYVLCYTFHRQSVFKPVIESELYDNKNKLLGQGSVRWQVTSIYVLTNIPIGFTFEQRRRTENKSFVEGHSSPNHETVSFELFDLPKYAMVSTGVGR